MHQDVPPHNTTIPPDFESFVRSAFEAMCDDVLLERYLKGATQNRNESATIIFNSGAVALKVVLEGLGVEAGPLCMATLSACDKVRLRKSVRKEKEVAKKRWKRKRQTEMSGRGTHRGRGSHL